MKQSIYLLFVVCLAAVLVKSESTIEIDENGDEYDVKRFNIQGRKLNEGRSQCVITRRKRAAPPKPMYSYDGANDEVQDKDYAEVIKGEAPQPILLYSPTIMTPTAAGEDDDEKQNVESDLMNMMNEMEQDKGESELMHNKEENKQNKTEEIVEMSEQKQKEDDKEENNKDRFEVIQLHQLPVASISSTYDAAQGATNDIVLVQSVDPPKVNPQTHAVFELVPVINIKGVVDDDDEDNDDAAEHTADDFDFKEDLSPITTTAIWSTGDQSLDDLYNDYDLSPLKDEEVVLKIRKPLKANNNKKTSLKPKRKNKYKNNNRRGLKKVNKKGGNNKRIPSKTKITGQNKNPNRNKNVKNTISNNKNQGGKTRKKLITKRNRNKKKGEINYQNGNKDDDKNVNCIIIRKDPPPAPPTTTPRPFWNIFGRSANGVPQASGLYGKRKRINIRFVP